MSPYRIFTAPHEGLSTLALILGAGVQFGSGWALLSAQIQTPDILSIIPRWLIILSWGLSAFVVTLGGLASAYLKYKRANSIRECRFPACPYEAFHKANLCRESE